MLPNRLYYGDNLDILQHHIETASVDLVYLDPPFNSNRNYNVLFKDESGAAADAQISAFGDTWHWGHAAEETYADLLTSGPVAIRQMIEALVDNVIGRNQMMAYLVMMAARLVELHRVLKPTGSLYLHCDPAASHYLKMILDAIFGGEHFQNEIIWERTIAKGLATRNLPANHDVILRFSRSQSFTWNQIYTDYSPEYLARFNQIDSNGRRYYLTSLINPSPDRPNLTYEFLGVTRVWRWTKERMQQAYEAGIVVQPKPGAVPRMKRYLDEQEGTPLGDVWTDIPPINSQAAERLGYPTQKPLALLERIIAASSNEGDTVLDPFAGCGTAIAAAHKLNRRWIGIDVTHLAITVQKRQLERLYGLRPKVDYDVIGEPVDVHSARALALQNRHQFEWWAISLVGALPSGGGTAPATGGRAQGKKGGDRGIDGEIVFLEPGNKSRRVLVSVKSNDVVNPGMLRDLVGVLEREKAAIGLFITLTPPTQGMIREAFDAGHYVYPGGQRFPRLQILTIDDLLKGKRPELPGGRATFAAGERIKSGRQVDAAQQSFDWSDEPDDN
jgi:DNA modification methylase